MKPESKDARERRDRAVEFCVRWWANARKHGQPTRCVFPEKFGLSSQMADVLHCACLAEWKGGKR